MSAVEPLDSPDTAPPAPTAASTHPAASAPARASAPPAASLPAVRVPAKKITAIALSRALPMALYQMNRMGRSGLTGAALILSAGVFFFSAVLPQYAKIAALRGEILQAQHNTGADATPHARISKFIDNLPRRSALPQIAGEIFKIPAAAGVTLDRGRYELAPLHSGHLARYRMTFPIKGRYPAIRHFIDTTLTTVPSAAVEGLRIERKSAGDDGVEAELGFTVFVRNDS